ncbi:hypothetical protein KGA66_20625 [Actinocrinis puniceicyclus]|uniref:Protein kinase domain-containing protein n=1 Tax=Actinocrinis puniceicyclus TaxID=977794 RepID=A0A8J8BG74_9ACTN|nr:hypothetical protein [Actinocrinis puniceicyclus]MBS2965469.1 hypothetical protein [Actinocrinis puniceicyclus]
MTLGRPGDLLADRYRLDRFVGSAGTAERWQAYDERLARPVTARIETAVGDEGGQQGSVAVARAALSTIARLNHPGVAAVYDMGTADELRGGAVGYAISEWTEGRTLGQIMAGGLHPWQRAADWGRQISSALAALHEIGIAHGALSPESVAIHDDRQVKIFDVGLDDVEPVAAAEADPLEGEDDDAGERELPAGAPEDVYALAFMLWEATVGAAPEYVAAGTEAAGGAPKGRDEAQDEAPDEPAEDERPGGREGAEVDQRPLLEAGAPAGFAVLLGQMLSHDPARRPTAAQAEERFLPFAASERAGDTLPGIAAIPAQTQVIDAPMAGAAAARVARPEPDRRRGAWLGLGLLVAALLAGLGLLLANLNSHPAGPGGLNPVVPSSSPGTVDLPDGTVSTVASQPAPTFGHRTGSTSPAPPSTAATSQAPSSPAASATGGSPSPSGVPTGSTPTSGGGSGGGGGVPASPSGSGAPASSASAGPGSQSQAAQMPGGTAAQ